MTAAVGWRRLSGCTNSLVRGEITIAIISIEFAALPQMRSPSVDTVNVINGHIESRPSSSAEISDVFRPAMAPPIPLRWSQRRGLDRASLHS